MQLADSERSAPFAIAAAVAVQAQQEDFAALSALSSSAFWESWVLHVAEGAGITEQTQDQAAQFVVAWLEHHRREVDWLPFGDCAT